MRCPKANFDWIADEDKQSSNNWKALNAIFNGVSLIQFKSIPTTELAKDAWDILQIKFEGTVSM